MERLIVLDSFLQNRVLSCIQCIKHAFSSCYYILKQKIHKIFHTDFSANCTFLDEFEN